MCTLVILRRPGHDWPVLIAANRDEMTDRPWKPPARHWPDRADVVAGLDELAGGTWLAINDDGVCAAVLNREGSLGPRDGKRSRGELVLEAVDHPDASDAADALSRLDGSAYRSFNLIIADNRDAFWVRGDESRRVDVVAIPDGLSMIAASDLNDEHHARIRRHLPRFRTAAVPDPQSGDWSAWTAILAESEHDGEPRNAMNIATDYGYGTVSSALIALPSAELTETRPVWLFAAGRPGEAQYRQIDTGEAS